MFKRNSLGLILKFRWGGIRLIKRINRRPKIKKWDFLV